MGFSCKSLITLKNVVGKYDFNRIYSLLSNEKKRYKYVRLQIRHSHFWINGLFNKQINTQIAE